MCRVATSWPATVAALLLTLGLSVSAQDAVTDPAASEPSALAEADAADESTLPVEPLRETPAQESDSTSPAVGTSALDEVVVTATRRQQSITRVPVAIYEISGEELESNVIRDTQSLVMQATSLNIQFSGSEANATIRIRGIGTGGANAGFESSVGVFVDGIYLPRPGLALTDLIDIDRIEVLRGPQGTLFGKNTTVGAIQILTRAPEFEPAAELRLSGGSFNNQIASGMINLPVLEDWLAFRVSGQVNTRDGYVTNLFNNEQYNNRDRYLVRAQALVTPTDTLSLRVIASRNEKDERCCVAPYTAYNPAAADNIREHGGTVFEPPQEYVVAFDYTDTFSKSGEESLAALMDWDLGDLKLKGLFSHATGFADDKRDGDFSDVDFAYQPFVNAQTKISTAELSLQGTDGGLDWLGGVFFSDETVAVQAQTLLGEDGGSFLLGNGVPPGTQLPLYPAGTGNTVLADQTGVAYSVFTHNVLSFGSGFDLTFGLRHLIEKKDGGGEATTTSPSCEAIPLVPGGTVPPLPGGTADPTRTTNSLRALCGADPYRERYEDKRTTGTLALGRTFENGLYAYTSYSRGFKAGGINLNPVSTVGGTFQFRPELIDNYELGVRFRLLGGRMQTRATYFFMDLTDYQVNAFDGTTFTVSNAGQVEASGIELESSLRLGDGWSFRGSYTFTDAVYAEGTQNLGFNGTSVVGKDLTNSPRRVGLLSANYSAPLRWWDMQFFATLSARYQSEVNTGVDLNPGKAQEAYTLLNGRIGLKLPAGFELSATGTNLTDVYYRQIIFDAVTRQPVGAAAEPRGFNGYPGNPRTLAVELLKRF